MDNDRLVNNLNKFIDEQYLSELSINTREVYKNAINKFINFLDKENISVVDKNVMIKYKAYLDEIMVRS